MTYTIENDFLEAKINSIGAELCSLVSKTTQQQYMWHGDAGIWAGTAPVLFPIVGALKEGSCMYKDQEYAIPKHGFIRNNENLEVKQLSASSITFSYKYSDKTLVIYPFRFEFRVTFRLEGNKLMIDHKVINSGEEEMLFSLGGHPAFKCPLQEGEDYSDYYIEFEEAEHDVRHLLSENGLTNGKTREVLNDSNKLPLTHTLFDEDALIFKNLKSRKATLKNTKNSKQLVVCYPGFDYMGIWAKPNGDFVCIEPWLGITDAEDSTRKLEEKEAMLKLNKGEFEATYSFEIIE